MQYASNWDNNNWDNGYNLDSPRDPKKIHPFFKRGSDKQYTESSERPNQMYIDDINEIRLENPFVEKLWHTADGVYRVVEFTDGIRVQRQKLGPALLTKNKWRQATGIK
ncbi:MAG: hypothetical protein HRT35_08855 [Algicola sp.]|nr:hypothetical protein [Algicola sp.]